MRTGYIAGFYFEDLDTAFAAVMLRGPLAGDCHLFLHIGLVVGDALPL